MNNYLILDISMGILKTLVDANMKLELMRQILDQAEVFNDRKGYKGVLA